VSDRAAIGNVVPMSSELSAAMETAGFKKEKSFRGLIARRQEFGGVSALRVMTAIACVNWAKRGVNAG
jgi:hypothetical protein